MKIGWVVLSFWLLSSGLSFAQAVKSVGEPFALVELFASEGCSDCPPADELLSAITAAARSSKKRIYTLSFQVDYWNYLGWRDPYSNPEFSQRQQRYSGFLPGGVYTPEMIINGKTSFVGSDEAKAQSYIEHYLQMSPENNISLELDQTGSDLKVNYGVALVNRDAVINFALVERGLKSQVTAGENNGRTLRHDNAVRVFKSIDLNNTHGTIVFDKPNNKDLTQFSIIAFIQSKGNMGILAASALDLKPV